ncbi:MAG TPA: alginate export family protein [Methylomirabilota bacterium]|nr:alginate export family protein [Methylomirabilota bacterium]
MTAAPPPASAQKDDWEEPVSPKEAAGGRDEEARRRLIELETWKKRQDARAAKEAEEAVEKVRFEVSGRYKLRLNSRDNLDLGNPLQSWEFDNSTYFDQRFQLSLAAEYGPLTAVLVLDKGNFVFDWKEDSQGTLDRWGTFMTVTPELVRELYAQYTGDFVVKAGRQNMLVGNGGIVLEGPIDALKLTYPVGETPLGRMTPSAAYLAVAGGFKDYKDFRKTGPPAGDRNAVFSAQNELHGGLFTLDVRPLPGVTIEPYLLKVFDTGRFGDADLNLDRDFDVTTTPRDGGFEPLWLGLALSGKTGPFSFTGDLIYLTGTFTRKRDLSAYAVMLRGDYRLGDIGRLRNFSVGLEFGRGSGNTAAEKVTGTGDLHDFIALYLCRDRRKFGNIFSEDLRAGFFLADSNLANVTFLRTILSFEPVSKLKVSASVAKLWTTEAVFRGHGPVGDWSRGTSLTTQKTRDIGWELDLNLDFPILKRLRGFAELGYFIPGPVYQRFARNRPDPASEIVVGMEYEF